MGIQPQVLSNMSESKPNNLKQTGNNGSSPAKIPVIDNIKEKLEPTKNYKIMTRKTLTYLGLVIGSGLVAGAVVEAIQGESSIIGKSAGVVGALLIVSSSIFYWDL